MFEMKYHLGYAPVNASEESDSAFVATSSGRSSLYKIRPFSLLYDNKIDENPCMQLLFRSRYLSSIGASGGNNLAKSMT